MIFVLLVFKISSQNPDFLSSYAARELQIHFANEYRKAVEKSSNNFVEYNFLNLVFYEFTKQKITRPSSYKLNVPKNPCYGIWRYFKPTENARCNEKIDLLRAVEILLNEIQTSPTLYRPKSAVSSRIMVKKNAILKNMNIELLKH